MFEGLRKHSQSFLLVILIASLATVFGVSFGPGSRGCSSGSLRVNHIARVYDTTIKEQDFQTLARLARLSEQRDPAAARQAIVNRLIERELLAHEAERLGFAVSEDELNREITQGYFYNALGSSLDRRRMFGSLTDPPTDTRDWHPTRFAQVEDRTPNAPPPPFNPDDFELWVRTYFGRTVREYKTLMAREVLAQRMRDAVMASVQVSEDEAWRRYQREHEAAALRYIQFSPEFYRLTVREDDQAAVDAFAQAHQEEINRQWEQRRESLRELPEQVRIRQILLRFPDDAEEPGRIATEQRAQAIRAQIVAPDGDFVRLARLYSQDDASWRTAGQSSWVTMERVDAPEDVKRVIPTLQPGQVSQPIRSGLGVHIVQLLGRRQGNVAEADAKREIARELYVLTRGEELAVEAANRAQQQLSQPGATLDSVATAVRAQALEAFYHGPIPEPVTLPGNNRLEPVSRDVGAPELRETQSFHPEDTIPGIENSEALVRAAFALTAQSPAPDAPVAVGSERFIVRLKEESRQTASREEFNRERLEVMDRLANAKRREALEQYLSRLRLEAERRGDVRIGNSPLIQQREPEGGGSQRGGRQGGSRPAPPRPAGGR